MKLTREILFDAAHNLAHYGTDHPNARIHGHSFRARISLSGAPDENGQIMDFETFGAVLETLRQRLDHHMLNDIEDLGTPTLENLCLWIWSQLCNDLPHICAVEVFRDSLGQSCLYQGSQHDKN
ncbi:MAG TPA: 6-carboxytetrahydropterin synthase QueD [Rhodobiaceae bacterium]|nr:6-carboxytetrahydropterin synthase QueD [Rhodobiaceae bacterium]